MPNQQLSFPGWDNLTEEQKLIFQDLLRVVANMEGNIRIIEEIAFDASNNCALPPDEYQVIDRNYSLELAVQDVQELVRLNLERNIRPLDAICEICRKLGKTDGYCANC